ncbi:MAG: sulfite exporter TauE/SafE family protein [Chloroflexota bacterium]
MQTFIDSYLFVENGGQFLLLSLVIVIAGIVRGCIGFGFSAILVASTSFWLPPVAVVNLAVLMEIGASVMMSVSIQKDVKTAVLIPLTLGTLLTSFIGTWLLATLSDAQLQWIIGPYLVVIALLTLTNYQFPGEVTSLRIFFLGLVSGFFNGLAAIGGIVAAWGLVGSKLPVRDIRATLAAYFIVVEILFLLAAYWNGIMTLGVILTAVFSLIPLALGIWLGARLFNRYPEALLKRLVLIALISLSLLGLYKTIF